MSRYAVVFPGQGSQIPGMGRDLAERFPESRAVFEAADRALGFPMSALCFEGSAEELALTENTQPALLTASIAAWQALAAGGLAPVAAAGHSLGEYSAQVAASAVAFDDAVRAVRQRGRFMQEAVAVGEGAMAAILGLPPDEVVAACREAAGDEVVDPANFNGPKQTVIAGHVAAVARAEAAALEAGASRTVPLDVSAPFHSSLMTPAGERLAPVLDEIRFADSSFPVYTNVDAEPVRRADGARDALIRQVARPVRWQQSVEAMIKDGIRLFVEVGPGKVLAGLVRRIDRDTKVLAAGDVAGVERVLGELT